MENMLEKDPSQKLLPVRILDPFFHHSLIVRPSGRHPTSFSLAIQYVFVIFMELLQRINPSWNQVFS
jgi:hypothetical protein